MNKELHMSLDVMTQVFEEYRMSQYVKVRLRVCHTGLTRKKIHFSAEAMANAKPTIINKPILAHVIKDLDGKYHFSSHDMHIEADEDGARLIYDERPIGVVPESCNYALEEHDGKIYVCVDGYIWRKYANDALAVLEDHSEVPLSMEMQSEDYTTSKDGEVIYINDFIYDGFTLLGNHIATGAEGAKGLIQHFANDSTAQEDFMKECAALQLALSGTANSEYKEKEAGTVPKDETTVTEPTNEEETTPDSEPEEMDDTPAEDEGTEPQEETGGESEATSGAEDDASAENTDMNFALASFIEKGLCDALYKTETSESYCNTLVDFDIDTKQAIVYDYYNGKYYAVSYAVSQNGEVVLNDDFREQILQYRDRTETDTISSCMEKAQVAFAEMHRQCKELAAEVESLKAAQFEVEKAAKRASIEMAAVQFSDLAENEEFKALMDQIDSIPDIETFTEKCFAIRGRNFVSNTPCPGEVKDGQVRTPYFSFNADRGTTEPSVMDKLRKRYQ